MHSILTQQVLKCPKTFPNQIYLYWFGNVLNIIPLISNEVMTPHFRSEKKKWVWSQNKLPPLSLPHKKQNLFESWLTCLLWTVVSASVKWEGWGWSLVLKLGCPEPLGSTGMPQGLLRSEKQEVQLGLSLSHLFLAFCSFLKFGYLKISNSFKIKYIFTSLEMF